MLITPKVGNTVLYNAGESQPHAATIAFVHNDELINIGGIDSRGVPFNEQNVKFCQPSEVIGEGECQPEDIYPFIVSGKVEQGADPLGKHGYIEHTKNIIEKAFKAFEVDDAEIIDNSAFNGKHSAPDGIVIDDNHIPDMAGAAINSQLASHQMNKAVQ